MGITSRIRTGIGTVSSFRGDPSFTVVGIKRNGNTVLLVADQHLAQRLVETYGVREGEEWTSMQPLIGSMCKWRENGVGVLVDLQPLLT